MGNKQPSLRPRRFDLTPTPIKLYQHLIFCDWNDYGLFSITIEFDYLDTGR